MKYKIKILKMEGIMESKNIKYLPGLDHIRAYAAVLMVIYHSILFLSYDQSYNRVFALDEWIYTKNFLSPLLIEGHTAVALFMVLSGFLFYLITYEKKIFYWKFIQNRILRIYPLFLFLIFVGISSYAGNFDFIIFLKTIFGFDNMPPQLMIGPYNAVSWAISVEFMFYLVFPFLIKIIKGKKDFFMLILLFVVFRVLSYLAGCSARDITYGTILGRMDQFIIGMFGSYLYIKFQNSNFKVRKGCFCFF